MLDDEKRVENLSYEDLKNDFSIKIFDLENENAQLFTEKAGYMRIADVYPGASERRVAL